MLLSLLVDAAHLGHLLLMQLFDQCKPLIILMLLLHHERLLQRLMLSLGQLLLEVIDLLLVLGQRLLLHL